VGDYRFHFSHHAVQRVDLRNLSTENLKNVVRYPDKKTKVNRPTKHKGTIWVFEKSVDSIKLKVVAEIKGEECWVMTSYEL